MTVALARSEASLEDRWSVAEGWFYMTGMQAPRASADPAAPSRRGGRPQRRKRAPSDPEIWAAHLTVVDGEAIGAPEFETDRARFLGRSHTVRAPIAVMDSRPLSNSVGAVLDPIFSIRRRIRVAPGATVRVAYWTIAAASRWEGAQPPLRPPLLVVRETEFCGQRLAGDFRRRTQENGRNSVRRPRCAPLTDRNCEGF